MLEVKNLTCGYDSKIILQNVNFKVERGELCGIIGPNGSGKTTLLRAISKILKVEGDIIFNSRDLKKLSFKELSKEIAVVSQTQSYMFGMTVEEFVLLGRIPYRKGLQFLETKEDEEIAYKAMLLTDVVNLKDRPISELSEGERQLVIIARALAQQPKLLLLDEPTSHLDITHQTKILDLLRKLNKGKKLTVLIILHDLNLASDYCNKLILLSNGRIYKVGKPSEVLTYKNIEEVYKTLVIVKENPVSGRPHIYLVPEKGRKNGKFPFKK